MKIAFPIDTDNGLDSQINSHFGTSRNFIIVDTETRDFEIVENQKLSDDKTPCKSHQIAKKFIVDAVITHCIGHGSLRNLNKSDITVYQAQEGTLIENLSLMEKGELKLFHMFDVCTEQKNKKEHKGCGHH